MSSAPSTTTTRQPPSAGVSAMKPLILRTSSTAICGAHAFALFVVGALDGQQVGVRAGGDAAEDRVGRVERQRVVGRAAGQQAAGEAVGERGLADAVRAGDQPGVVHAAGAHGVQHGGLGGLVAEQNGVGARFGGGHPVSINQKGYLGR